MGTDSCTLNHKPFVNTKPRGSVVMTKPLALQRTLRARKVSELYGPQVCMSAWELTLLLLTVFLCKYTKVMLLCKSKRFNNFIM